VLTPALQNLHKKGEFTEDRQTDINYRQILITDRKQEETI